MKPPFRITVGSEPGHEDLVGDVYFDDRIVCVVTQEDGFDAMQIEILAPDGSDAWEFALRDFEDALSALKKRLWDLRRVPPDES